MKIPTWKRIAREDLGEMPPGLGDVIDRFLDPLNRQLEQITAGLQNALSFKDNFNAEIVNSKFADGVAQEFRLRSLKGKPTDVVLTRPHAGSGAVLDWAPLESDLVRLTVNWATPPASATLCRIVCLGE